jgi:octaprenyl-diphosphate synthase
MLLLDEKHRALNELLAEELAAVEAHFAGELVSRLECVNGLIGHIERYRGKMLRPMLLLITGRACHEDAAILDAHRTLGAVIEMVHMATLVHDDILDEARTRRQGATINALRGNETAVMLGDYLISHAYHLCSSLEDQAYARLIAHATNTVCEGELLQLHNRYNWDLDEATYFDIIDRKTGALCGSACRLGALVSGADEQVGDAVDRFGTKVGAAFQVVDDVLDLVGAESVAGKTLGLDLEKGKLTLPLIRLLQRRGEAEALRDLLDRGDPDRASRVAALLKQSTAVEDARAVAVDLIDQAKSELQVLRDSDARDMLAAMADAVLTRQA